MAYDKNKLTRLGALEELAKRVNADFATKQSVTALETKVTNLESAGGEPNVITSIKVNGTTQTVTDKAVNITVPTKVSQITNDSKFQTDAEVKGAVNAAINTFMTNVSDDGTVNTYKELVDYAAEHKGEAATMAGDIAKNKTDIATLKTDVAGKVDKVDGKVLSSNDYTTEEKNKLAGIAAGANNYVHPSHTANALGLYRIATDAQGHVASVAEVKKADITALGIPAQDTTYGAASASANGLMSSADKTKLDGMNIATDEEVAEMLNTVFAA